MKERIQRGRDAVEGGQDEIPVKRKQNNQITYLSQSIKQDP